MAGPNSFLQSPFQSLINGQPKPLPGAQQVTEVDTPDLSADAAPAPTPDPAPAPAPVPSQAAAPASLLPPESMRPLFEATASHFKVPVNVLMAIAQQESSYNPDATNKETDAAGIGQYIGATAKSLGINPRDPNEAVPAIAMQLRERLDKGYSMADAVKEHFAGPDRKLWGEKTAAYGAQVLDKAGQIGQQLYGDTSDAPAPAPAPAFTPGAEQNQFAPNRMARADYEKEFRALNPKANDAAVQNAMAQYDQQAVTKTQAAGNRVQNKFATMQSPEATFDARLNAKLQAGNQGVAQALPERQQPAAFPETGTQPSHADPSTFDTVAGNVTGGALGTLVGAIAAGAHLVGADDIAKEYGEGLEQIKSRQKELGGDTMTGKVSSLVGGIVPAMAGAPEYKVLEFVKNAGLFGIPAFQETYKAKLAEGQDNKLALVHAFEAFGMNTLAPLVMQHGMGAVIGKLGAEGAAGVKGAALGLGQAAGEGVAFSAANSVMDKGTDALAGQQNDRPWIDPEDMAVQAMGFGAMRGGHMAAHAVGDAIHSAIPDPSAQAADGARADALARWQNDGLSPGRQPAPADGRVEPTLGDAPDQQAPAVDPADMARADAAARAGASVADQLRAIRPPEPAGPLTGAIEHAAAAPTSADAGPMSTAIERAADLHAVDPAPTPPAPEPAPPALDTLPMEDLRARLRDVAQQVKQAADPAQRKELMGQRGEIEKAIAAVGKQATADSKPASEPLSAGPFDDMKAANRMMQRFAEDTGQPHEVVGSDGKFKVQPIEGARDGIDTAGSGTGPDGSGRSGGPAGEVGSDHGAGRAGTGTVHVEGGRAGLDTPAEKRGENAGDHRTGADGTADAKPALTNPHADHVFQNEAKADAFVKKNGIDRNHFDVVQTGPDQWKVQPYDGPHTEFRPAEVEGQNRKKAPGLSASFDNGKGSRGVMDLAMRDGRLYPAWVDSGVFKGSTGGKVRAMYERAIDEAEKRGLRFTSDDSVTVDAARIYDALAKRGYDVVKNPDAKLVEPPDVLTARWRTDDGSPVYTVKKEIADVPERPQVPEKAPPAQGEKAKKPAAGAAAGAGAEARTPADAPTGKLAARRALNDKQDAVVRAAAEKLAARKAEKQAQDAAHQAARNADEEKTATPEPAAPSVPKSFMKKVKVDHEVYIKDERRWETVKVPADKALASVREDISNLEALLKCMKG